MSHSPVRQRTDPKARLIASEGLRPTIAPSRRGVRYHASANAPYDARVSIREAPIEDTPTGSEQQHPETRVRYHAARRLGGPPISAVPPGHRHLVGGR